MTVKQLVLIGLVWMLAVSSVMALEVDREVKPRLTLGGRVVATLDATENDAEGNNAEQADSEINIDDTSLLLRLDKRMYRNGVGGAVIGLKDDHKQALMHQAHVFFWNEHVAFRLGRQRLANTIVEFPVLRDDDLLPYTHVLNGSSDDEFDQLYAGSLKLDWFLDRKNQSIGIWSAGRGDGEAVGGPEGLDSYGAGYRYEPPESLVLLKPLRHAGVMVDNQKVDTTDGEDWISAVIAGGEFNLNKDPSRNWSAAIQGIHVNGIDAVTDLGSTHNQARASSKALVMSLRYTRRPHLLTRWQAGLTLAYQDYSDIDHATRYSAVPSLFYRMGEGVDWVGQVIYTSNDDALNGGDNTVRFQAGLVFNLDATFNDTIGERNSILNLEHGYIQ